ncbi:hypothetical protein [Shinella oryzae]|uniref:hypothetical protein n=1 Tax=Shinella oryzae TaxID=2871820 RepID=UPI001FF43756|nr:hypothetical protein [Shinella oryzae]UPA27449.1 hypothetical protein K6301_18025 [Shinella oryzae]
MTLQNRVTPFGEIVAIAQRGLFTGNRGIIHDPATRTLLKRRWTSKAWIICACDFKGVRRDVMAGHSWTELFFLDEAVALAAGHRPCFFCRRPQAEQFRACFPAEQPSAPEMDARLHAERLENGQKRRHPMDGPPSALPDGAVVAVGVHAYTMRNGRAHRWTVDGYAPAQDLDHADSLLTPPSTIMALRAGYSPVFHPSIAPGSP